MMVICIGLEEKLLYYFSMVFSFHDGFVPLVSSCTAKKEILGSGPFRRCDADSSDR